ncbi:MAG: hypothetical protein HYU66_12510, partial [Armatimonadetes bacterium]|nr:hypothetical protein [Armatimonadota bacterium]
MAEPDLVHHPAQWLTIRYPKGLEFDEIQTYVGPVATEEEQAGAVGQRDPDLFLLTESYLTFVQRSKLLAFGRRGTGKTAMVFQLLDEVRSGRHPDYLCGTVISQDQYLQRLVTRVAEGGLTHYSDNVLLERFAEEWRRVLKVHALRAVLEWAAEHQVDNRAAGRIRLFFHGHRAMRPLLDALNRRRRPADPAHLAEAVMAVARDLDSEAACAAFDALHELAADNDRSILVMADSPDNFSWTDPLTRLALSGLIEAARSLYAEGPEVVPKLTLPSELYPHLIFMNPGKSAPQTVFLLWQYHHLLTLLAKRWHAYVECGGRHLDTTLLAGLSDVNEATRYLYERIPGQLTTRHGVVFPVLPYTVRHTQKKPRQ